MDLVTGGTKGQDNGPCFVLRSVEMNVTAYVFLISKKN